MQIRAVTSFQKHFGSGTLQPFDSISSAGDELSTSQTRAILLAFINQIAQGRSSVRYEVVEFLVNVLNSSALPRLVFTSETEIYKQIVVAAQGLGTWYNTTDKDASASVPSAAPGVTYADVFGLQFLSTAASVALGGLSLYGANALLSVADATASLSVEAAQASAIPFQSDNNESVRSIAGVSTSSNNISLLLNGSLEVGKALAPPAEGSDAAVYSSFDAIARIVSEPSFLYINQYHGSGHAPLQYATRVIQSELSSAPTTQLPFAPRGAPKFPATVLYSASELPIIPTTTSFSDAPIRTALGQVAEVLNSFNTESQKRCKLVQQIMTIANVPYQLPASPEVSKFDSNNYLLQLQILVDETILTLGNEYIICSQFLQSREEKAAEAQLLVEKQKAEAAAKRQQAEAARIAAMSPEEREKWEAQQAKRREKAEKQAKRSETVPNPATEKVVQATTFPNPLHIGPTLQGVRTHVATTAKSVFDASPLSPYFPGFPFQSVKYTGFKASPMVSPAPLLAPSVDISSIAPSPSTSIQQSIQLLLEKASTGGTRRKPKIPRGTRDYLPGQMEVRESTFNKIRAVFKRHGAVELDTPVFELRETLMGKYGEEGGKLIYDLADQGGELLSLRYDLTVPFARFLAMHGLETVKRFHIAKVYRRDNPQINRGRYREFYQCDFDIAGNYAPMVPDAEVLTVAKEILSALPIGPFAIKLNHRKLLDACLDIAGVPSSKFRSICSAIDKLDKEPWSDVRDEMVLEKGLEPHVADKIGEMVQLAGEPRAVLRKLQESPEFVAHPDAQVALTDLELLFDYLEATNAISAISFDLSLARGLDYYTGVIYEAILLDSTYGVGSIAAGGRYDNLVGMFSPSNAVVPCVGVSIGVERVFAILEAKAQKENGALKKTPVQISVASIPSKRYNMTVERLKICAKLWGAGFSAETTQAPGDPKLARQLTSALEAEIPYLVVIAEDELDKGEIQVKGLNDRESKNIKVDDLVPTMLEMGARPTVVGVGLAEKL